MGAGVARNALNSDTLKTTLGALWTNIAPEGKINKTQFIKAANDSLTWMVAKVTPDKKIGAVFDTINSNGGQYFEQEELEILLKEYGLTFEQARYMTVDEIITYIDNKENPKPQQASRPQTREERKKFEQEVTNNYWETMSRLPTKW